MDWKKKLVECYDDDYIISLTQQLVRIPSESPAENARSKDRTKIVELIRGELEEVGIKTDIITLLEGRPNITGTIKGTGGGPKLILYSHCDTGIVKDSELQDWDEDPFSGIIKDGKILGRGATDTKGGVAGVIATARAIIKSGIKFKGDVEILITTASEAGAPGGMADLAREKMVHADGAVVADCSDAKIVNIFKGRVWHEFVVTGKYAHASTPEKGINAIEKMQKLISALNESSLVTFNHDYLGPCTLTIATIQGGTALNTVPGRCRITTDLRLVPGQTVDGATQEFERIVKDLMDKDSDFKAEVNVLPNAKKDLIEIRFEDPIVQSAKKAMEFISGKAEFMGGIQSPGAVTYFYEQLGIPAIFLGPGSIWYAHVPNEAVEIENVLKIAKIYGVLTAEFCGVVV